MLKSKKVLGVLAVIAVVIALSAGACDPPAPKETAQTTGQKLTENAFANQQAAVPYPATQLRNSAERQNLRKRLLITNDPNLTGYLYLFSFGKPIGYYVVKGKVSSTDSQMTTSTTVERHNGDRGGNIAYPAPGDDGSYGANENGIFFFTSSGEFVTTNLDYIWSDKPLPIDVPLLRK